MTQQDAFEKMLPLLEEVFGVDAGEISEKTDLFADLYGDEMDIVELSMIIEEEFDFLTDDDEMSRIVTVGDLCSYISRHTD